MSDTAYSSAPFSLPADPTENLDAVTKQYVDTADSGKVSKAGDTMTGPLYLPTGGSITDTNQVPDKAYVDNYIANHPPIAEDIVCDPIGDVAAANVQAAIEELDSEKVARAGDAMSGLLQLSADPVLDLHAATKQMAERQGTKIINVTLSSLPYETLITHNMGRRVNVTLEDNYGNTGWTNWTYDVSDPLNKLTVYFGGTFIGKVILT